MQKMIGWQRKLRKREFAHEAAEAAKPAEQERLAREEEKEASCIAFFGNSGAEKSTIANCIAEKILFKVGPACRIRVTKDLNEKTVKCGRFKGCRIVDLPGLVD